MKNTWWLFVSGHWLYCGLISCFTWWSCIFWWLPLSILPPLTPPARPARLTRVSEVVEVATSATLSGGSGSDAELSEQVLWLPQVTRGPVPGTAALERLIISSVVNWQLTVHKSSRHFVTWTSVCLIIISFPEKENHDEDMILDKNVINYLPVRKESLKTNVLDTGEVVLEM